MSFNPLPYTPDDGSGPEASDAEVAAAIAAAIAGHDHSGTYVALSTVDAAADLLVGTANDTVGRLAKGSALDVLRVNAGATALEWAAPAGGGALVRPPLVNRNAGAFDLNYALPGWTTMDAPVSGTGSARTANTIYWTPIYIAKSAVFDRVGVKVTGTGAGGSVTRLALYTAGATTLTPDTLIQDFGTVVSDSGGVKEITITTTVAAGWYWLAACTSTTATLAAITPGAYPPFTVCCWGADSGAPGASVIAESAGQTGVPAGGFASTAPAITWGTTGVGRGGIFLRYNRASN